MSATLSPKMYAFKQSPTMEMTARVARLRAEGKRVLSLNVGEPDFPTPEHIKQAAIDAIEGDFTKYTLSSGLPELRQAVSDKLRSENNLGYCADEIIITIGAKQALMAALTAILDEGDEVIIPVPCYVSYPDMVKLLGAVPVFAEVNRETMEPDINAIRDKVSDRTKAIIICTPNNPSGAVYSEDILREIAALANEKDFYIVTDEVYEKLTFGKEHFSIGSISDEVRDRTITVNGFSKTYCMTGWRIGYAAANKEISAAMNKIQGQNISCVSPFIQKAAIEALSGPQDSIEIMRKSFEERMEYCYRRLNDMPGITCPRVNGAFYLLPDISGLLDKSGLETDVDFCNYILDEAGVAIMPGSAFYGPGTVRIAYTISMDELKEAMDLMEDAVRKL